MIGNQAKQLIDWGRARYLQQHGFTSELVAFIDKKYTLENVCLLAHKPCEGESKSKVDPSGVTSKSHVQERCQSKNERTTDNIAAQNNVETGTNDGNESNDLKREVSEIENGGNTEIQSKEQKLS